MLPFFLISHTGMLECYHNLLLAYVPKRLGYDQSYRYRVLLGALDHNHHLDRAHTSTSSGVPRYHRKFRKRTKRWDVVPVKNKKDYAYITKMLIDVMETRNRSHEAIYSMRAGKRPAATTPLPPPLSQDIVVQKKSRFL